MSLYAIADTHLSLGEEKPMDVFAGWDNYAQRLSENWKKLVTEEDTVVRDGTVYQRMREESGDMVA